MIVVREVEVNGAAVDVGLSDGLVTEVAAPGTLRPGAGDELVLGGGGALLPGLHDHHVHLLATAAQGSSVVVGPPAVQSEAQLVAALRRAATSASVGGGWVRAVGYHESVAGPLDAAALERWVPGVPVRVQHRSGSCWILNETALAAVPLSEAPSEGLELGPSGEPTGRLFRLDTWLRGHVPAVALDLAGVGTRAAEAGVTGCTDADPTRHGDALALLVDAHLFGELPQRLCLMGPEGLARALERDGSVPASITVGPVKVLADDDDFPPVPDLAARMVAAHGEGRGVAVHCVTRLQLVAALAAFDDAGPRPGDRIEHGALIPVELIAGLAERGLTVVTQPNLVAERGDRYRVEVEPADRPDLWRLRSLLAAGVAVAGGTDAPHGDPDPWAAIAAAVHRVDGHGRVLGPDERIDARRALDLFLGGPIDPSVPRRVTVGAPADLCLLHEPLAEALCHPDRTLVAATWISGVQVAGG